MTEFLCALPLVSALLACPPDLPRAVGYVEGDYVQLAPIATAEIDTLDIREGERVAAGATVARQVATDAEIARAKAEAARDEAAATLADLRQGSRPEELAVIEAALAAARARLAEAERIAERQVTLASGGVVSEANLDRAVTGRDLAATEVQELQAELAVAHLPARPHALEAAESRLARAEAALREAAWRLEQRSLAAHATGEITAIYRRAGELAGPNIPVAELLPDGAVELVIHVPQDHIAEFSPGRRLAVACDGCPEGLTATVTRIADGPEFTPPVIYSVETRAKLVWRVEARPEVGAALRPGQIVDVTWSE